MTIDVLLLILAGWGFYQGFTKGIIKTVFTVISIVFGLVAAFKLTPAATRFIETAFKTDEAYTFILGFLLAFILAMVIIRLIAQLLEKALESANINVINQLAGGVLMAAIYTLVFSLLVWFGDKSHIITQEARNSSRFYPFVKEFPGKMKNVYEYMKPTFQEFWQESVRFMDRLEEKSMEQQESEPDIFDIPEEEPDTTQ